MKKINFSYDELLDKNIKLKNENRKLKILLLNDDLDLIGKMIEIKSHTDIWNQKIREKYNINNNILFRDVFGISYRVFYGGTFGIMMDRVLKSNCKLPILSYLIEFKKPNKIESYMYDNISEETIKKINYDIQKRTSKIAKLIMYYISLYYKNN